MIAEADIPTAAPLSEPPGFAERDFTIGVEMDDSQKWIGELLAERIRQIDAGEVKMHTLKEFKEHFRRLLREKSNPQ